MTRGGLGLLGVWLLAAAPAGAAEALRLDPENPHYFLFRGKPALIVTSGEHYGAVLNLDFDYTRYLTTLGREGMNGTRTWVGAYCEPNGAFSIAANTLAPRPNRLICPWARSGQSGYQNGGNRFDLSKWDSAYFKRLKDFVYQAGKRGIIVEVNLFCPFYEESMWQLSPMNALNNVNGLGAIERTNVYTLDKNEGLLAVQEALARKVVSELNQFDNLYYEICNEPYFGGVTLEWQRHIGDIIVQTEKGLERRHLISRNIANGTAKVEDPEPALSILNFHYASPPDAVGQNYELNRVIGDNETGFRGTNDAPYRMEAWDFIVAGGGLFNNLDYSFTAGHEDGTFVYPASQPGGGVPALRRQLRFLGEFMRRFDLVHLRPQAGLVVGGVPAGMTARALGRPGQDYIIYLRSAPQTGRNGHYPAATFADGQVVLEAALPVGEFNAQWFNPRDGSVLRSEPLIVAASPSELSSPAFEDDIVLAIRQARAAPVAKAPPPARPAAASAPETKPGPVPIPASTKPASAAAKPEEPGAPEQSQGVSDAAYRMRAWETILTTGPGSRKISYATVPEGASHALRQQIRFLNDFLHRHDPRKMEPANDLVSGGLPAGITPRALKRPGQDYVIYLRQTAQGAGEPQTSPTSPPIGQLTLQLALPPGEFNAQWFDTRQGLTLFSERFTKTEGMHQLVVPVFQDDIVVAIHPTALAKAKKEVKTATTDRPATAEPNLPKPRQTSTLAKEPSAPAPTVAPETPTPAATPGTNQVRVAKPNWLRRLFGAGTPSPSAEPKSESGAPVPPPVQTETAKAEAVTPPPVQTETAKAEAVTPPPAQTETAKAEAVTPPPAQTETAKAKAVTPPPVQTETAKAEAVTPPPVQTETAKAEAVTPPSAQTETAKAKAVTPPSAQTEAAKAKSTAPPRVWIDPAYVSQAGAPVAARSASAQKTPRPSEPSRAGAPKTAASGADAAGPGPRQAVRAVESPPEEVESPATTRMDAWDLVLAGGVPPENLVQSIPSGPARGGAPGGGGVLLRAQLRFLSDFARRFDIARMEQDKTLITGHLPAGMTARVLARPGQAYIVYLRPVGPQPQGNGLAGAASANRQVVLGLNLPAGRYSVEWLDPRRALPISYQQLNHPGGLARFAAPAFGEDVVLALRKE